MDETIKPAGQRINAATNLIFILAMNLAFRHLVKTSNPSSFNHTPIHLIL
jgi:hypothetical protein